jgi:hypothetical protein
VKVSEETAKAYCTCALARGLPRARLRRARRRRGREGALPLRALEEHRAARAAHHQAKDVIDSNTGAIVYASPATLSKFKDEANKGETRVQGQNMNRALRAWGVNPPDWIMKLAAAATRRRSRRSATSSASRARR